MQAAARLRGALRCYAQRDVQRLPDAAEVVPHPGNGRPRRVRGDDELRFTVAIDVRI
jgi:hypothetical protein